MASGSRAAVGLICLIAASALPTGCAVIDPNTIDYDGDGVPDVIDAFPADPDEHTDSDGDGVGDNSDAFPTDPDRTASGDQPLGDDAQDTADDATGDEAAPDITGGDVPDGTDGVAPDVPDAPDEGGGGGRR